MANADITSDFIAAWNNKDLDAIMEFFTEDAAYANVPMGPLTARGVPASESVEQPQRRRW